MTKQTVTYNNLIEFNGRKLAFKSKNLWDITGSPKMIPESEKGWYVNRMLPTKLKAKSLVKTQETVIDLSGIAWNIQEQIKLGETF